MITKVFAVFTGEYSDRNLRGVYTTKENADKAADLYASDEIVEFELDELPVAPPGMLLWLVTMEKDGTVVDYCGVGIVNVDVTIELKLKCDQYFPRTYIKWKDALGVKHTSHGAFYIWAPDKETAIKAASEKRAQLVAAGSWPIDEKEYVRCRNKEFEEHKQKEKA